MKRKKLLLAGLAAGAGALTGTNAEGQTITAFTAGDVVVYRVGDGSAALTNAGTAVFLDEYNPTTGTLDGSMALSTIATPLVASGTATSEGLINLSGNGQYLLATGYDATVGTTNAGASITGTATTGTGAVPREVATISGTGVVVQTTTTGYSANNIRSAASQDGVSIYTSGANTGILNVTSGAVNTAGTNLYSTVPNDRAVSVYNGQLYFSTGSGTALRIATLGTGLPTTTGQTATQIPGIAVSSTVGTPVDAPYQFAAVTLTLGSTTTDTIYVADNGSGLVEKYTGSLATGFTLKGTVALGGVTGLTAEAVAGGELLVLTTPGTTGTGATTAGLYTLLDTSGAGGTLTGTATLLDASATNEAFRGDAFAPSVVSGAVPEPSTWAAMVAGALGLFSMLRLRRPEKVGV